MSEEEYQRTEIDGVPVWYADCPGPALGALIFRVGVCDETLLGRGVTHLVEHLALSPLNSRTTEFNGSVGPSLTNFTVRGEPEEVCGHLSAVARSLAALPLDRAPLEAKILRAEASQRGPSAFGRASTLRFGVQGSGLIDYEELILHDPQPDVIEAHRQRFMNRSNAVVILSRPPTPDLDLSSLPAGSRMPVAPQLPLGLRLPAWDVISASTVMLSVEVERSVVFPMVAWVLGEHLRATLRELHGLSYNAASDYMPWSSNGAHLSVWADSRPEDALLVAEQLQTELSRVAIEGVAAADLDDYRTMLNRGEREPLAPYGRCHYHATEHLFGNPARTDAEVKAEIGAVTTDGVRHAIEELQRSALWLVPNHVLLADRRLTLVPQWSSTVAGGEVFVPAEVESPWKLRMDQVGVSVSTEDGRAIHIAWETAAACKQWSDGARTLFGQDGFVLTIDPEDWRGGNRLPPMVDQYARRDRCVVSAEPLRPAPVN